MTISIKPTASGSTIEQDGSTILTVDGSGNITPSNQMYPKVPSFSAYIGTTQTLSDSTATKMIIDTVEHDTHSDFDNTTNYRYTPSVAGYYQVNAQFRCSNTTGRILITLYKNGNITRNGGMTTNKGSAADSMAVTLSTILYMNGTTDYLELYMWQGGSGVDEGVIAGPNHNYFQAHLVSV